jgi:hypothetical protein
MVGAQIPAWVLNFSLCHVIQMTLRTMKPFIQQQTTNLLQTLLKGGIHEFKI